MLITDPRSVTPAGKETIRDKIVLAMVALFQREVTLPNGDLDPDWTPIPFDKDDPSKGPLFDFAMRGTLDDILRSQTPAIAIEEAEEGEPRSLYFPFVDSTFRVICNFKVIKQQGVDVLSLVNYYFGRITQELVRPEVDGLHFAGLTISIVPAGNSMQTNGDSDPEPGGSIFFDVEYRTVQGDPFSTEYPNG